MESKPQDEQDAAPGFGFLSKPRGIIDAVPVVPDMHAEQYNMNHRKRGLAVFFSHDKYSTSHSSRDGALQDVTELQKQLALLSFEVQVCRNYTKSKIFAKLEELAKYDHSECDCLVVAVMTHGDTNELSAYDTSYRTNKLWESFTADKCKTLVGKPKLFFIQACRGSQVDDGVRVTPLASTQTDGSPRITYTIPSTADILIANATFDGYYAWRKGDTGSWFIQELCKCLARFSETKEICEILTAVNRGVAIAYESYVPNTKMHQKKQMPNFLSTLTRELYLKRKPTKYLATAL